MYYQRDPALECKRQQQAAATAKEAAATAAAAAPLLSRVTWEDTLHSWLLSAWASPAAHQVESIRKPGELNEFTELIHLPMQKQPQKQPQKQLQKQPRKQL